MEDSQGEFYGLWRTVKKSVVNYGGQPRRVFWSVEDSQGEYCGLWRTVKERVVDCGGNSRRVLWMTVKENVVYF